MGETVETTIKIGNEVNLTHPYAIGTPCACGEISIVRLLRYDSEQQELVISPAEVCHDIFIMPLAGIRVANKRRIVGSGPICEKLPYIEVYLLKQVICTDGLPRFIRADRYKYIVFNPDNVKVCPVELQTVRKIELSENEMLVRLAEVRFKGRVRIPNELQHGVWAVVGLNTKDAGLVYIRGVKAKLLDEVPGFEVYIPVSSGKSTHFHRSRKAVITDGNEELVGKVIYIIDNPSVLVSI